MSEKYKNSRKKAGLNRIIRQSQALDKSKEHITFNFEYFTYSEKGGQSFLLLMHLGKRPIPLYKRMVDLALLKNMM